MEHHVLFVFCRAKQSALWLTVAIAFIILLSYLGPILMPFIVAGIFAYVLNPSVNRLCRLHLGRWSMPRSLAVALVIVLVLMLMLTLFLIMVPILRTQIPLLQNQIPLFLDKLNLVLTPFLSDLGFHVKLDSAGIKAILTEHLAASSEDIGKAVLASIKVGGTAVLGMVANLVLIPVVLFYLLMEWAGLVRTLENAIPRRYLHKTQAAIVEVDGILAQFLRGQIMLMLSLAVYYSLALALVKFNLAC